MRKIGQALAVSVVLSVGATGITLAADPDRGSATAPSASGQEGANLDKSRGSEMGGMRQGEASLKQEEREKQDIERNKDKAGGKDPLEQQDPGPGSGKSSGTGSGL
jgi:hypothetical protein